MNERQLKPQKLCKSKSFVLNHEPSPRTVTPFNCESSETTRSVRLERNVQMIQFIPSSRNMRVRWNVAYMQGDVQRMGNDSFSSQNMKATTSAAEREKHL